MKVTILVCTVHYLRIGSKLLQHFIIAVYLETVLNEREKALHSFNCK